LNNASWISFYSLLEQRRQSSFLRFLSPAEQEKCQNITAPKTDPFSAPYSMETRLEKIHYSWLITFLEPLPQKDKECVLSSLNEMQAKRLKAHFKIKEKSLPIKKEAKNYLIETIYKHLISDQREFLPIEFLPDNPLNALVNLSKKLLQTLVDYLGLQDLAIDLKHVVKSEQITKIQTILSQSEQKYLKKQMKIKGPIIFSRLNLDGWNGNGEKLRGILHHRGFNRLAKALFGSHPALLWHICHRLDTGRAKILRKFFTDVKNETMHASLINQTLELVEYLLAKENEVAL